VAKSLAIWIDNYEKDPVVFCFDHGAEGIFFYFRPITVLRRTAEMIRRFHRSKEWETRPFYSTFGIVIEKRQTDNG